MLLFYNRFPEMSRQKHEAKYGYIIESRCCKVSPDNFQYFLPDRLLTALLLYSIIVKECKRSHERKNGYDKYDRYQRKVGAFHK